MKNHDIMIFAEQRDGELQKIVFELLSGARDLANQTGGRVIALLLGHQAKDAAAKLYALGADEILAADDPALTEYLAAPYTKAAVSAVRTADPEIMLFGSTMIGMELAPLIAAELHTGLLTDCTGLSINPENNQLLMVRPDVDGIMINTYQCNGCRPQMATVRPGVLAESQEELSPIPSMQADSDIYPEADRGKIRTLSPEFPPKLQQVKIRSTTIGRVQNTDITQARVLVAGGRGVGSADGFKPLSTLAKLLGGTIACSRACIESGWVDPSIQVGQTGKTVHPDLYLACGISGAFQHITGMKDSKLIISINKSPSAPIFELSDLGIVANVEVLLPRLIEALKAYQSG